MVLLTTLVTSAQRNAYQLTDPAGARTNLSGLRVADDTAARQHA
jgi:hypothetical protein